MAFAGPLIGIASGVMGMMGSMASGKAQAANAMMAAQNAARQEQAAAQQSRWNEKVAAQMAIGELQRAAVGASDLRFKTALQVMAPLRARMADSGFEYKGSLPMVSEAIGQQAEFAAVRQGWEGDVAAQRRRTESLLENWKGRVHDQNAQWALTSGQASANNIMQAARIQGMGSLIRGVGGAFTSIAGQQPYSGTTGGGTFGGGYASSTPQSSVWNNQPFTDWGSVGSPLAPTSWYTTLNDDNYGTSYFRSTNLGVPSRGWY